MNLLLFLLVKYLIVGCLHTSRAEQYVFIIIYHFNHARGV